MSIVFVGYTLRPVENLDKISPAADKAIKKEGTGEHRAPGIVTFDTVNLVDPSFQRRGPWTYEGRGPAGPKPSIAQALVEWLVDPTSKPAKHPDAFTSSDQTLYCGFGIAFFIELLRWEASLGHVSTPALVAGLWRPVFVEIGDILRPDASAQEGITWETALALRTPKDPEAAIKWKETKSAWKGPHRDSLQDVELAMELAALFRVI
jgi:hypothetical protein